MRWAIAAVLAVLFVSDGPSARAFTISTGFTPACHETISARAFARFLQEIQHPPLHASAHPKWIRVAYGLSEKLDVGVTTDAEALVLLSLIVGVRSPDTGGHSTANITQLRSLHADPEAEGQYLHALRAPADDGPAGDARAVAGTRRSIQRTLQQALTARQLPEEQQFGQARMYLDFYGDVSVPVWWPAYYFARAAHTVQDSFSHMLRDRASGLHEVVHVLNYVDAITLHYREARDGLPHSSARDTCAGETTQSVTAATTATLELMRLLRLAIAQEQSPALDAFLDRWFVLRPGCDVDNEMCGNPEALAIARKHPTGPYLPVQRHRSERRSNKR